MATRTHAHTRHGYDGGADAADELAPAPHVSTKRRTYLQTCVTVRTSAAHEAPRGHRTAREWRGVDGSPKTGRAVRENLHHHRGRWRSTL